MKEKDSLVHFEGAWRIRQADGTYRLATREDITARFPKYFDVDQKEKQKAD